MVGLLYKQTHEALAQKDMNREIYLNRRQLASQNRWVENLEIGKNDLIYSVIVKRVGDTCRFHPQMYIVQS